MDRQEIAQQTQIEHKLVKQVVEGLRLATGWEVSGQDATRKLSTLRFVTQSFQRHLERLLALEEYDGYLGVVSASAPHLARSTVALQEEHNTFRDEVRQIVERLEQLQPTDLDGLDDTCQTLLQLLDRIETHNHKEISLLLEAFVQEEGGEG